MVRDISDHDSDAVRAGKIAPVSTVLRGEIVENRDLGVGTDRKSVV